MRQCGDTASDVTLNLTVKQPVSTSISATACGSYTWNNEVYTTNGEYVQTFQAANGCDSVVILTLTINPVYDPMLSVVSHGLRTSMP